jgi:hypothetical protein
VEEDRQNGSEFVLKDFFDFLDKLFLLREDRVKVGVFLLVRFDSV